jgi:hypothetical protein
VSRLPIGSLWRAAACAALIAFACLPHGHLRGHEEVAAARAQASHGDLSFAAVPIASADEARHRACPICLSLARVRDALAQGADCAGAPLVASAQCAPPCAPLRPEAPASAHTAPRAPPLA